MTKFAKSIEIEASPEKVFAFLLDAEKMNEVTKGYSESEYTSKGAVGVGTTLHSVSKAGGQQAEVDMKVTEFVKDKKISMHTIGASKVKADNSYTLEPIAKGTKLTMSMGYELPYSVLGKIVDKLRVSKDVEKTMEKQLGIMKKALET